jgi:hypothetical protein
MRFLHFLLGYPSLPPRQTPRFAAPLNASRQIAYAGGVKSTVIIAALLCATANAAAQTGAPIIAPDASAKPPKPAKPVHGTARQSKPLPVVIPQQFAPPQEEYASFPDAASAAAAPAAPSACQIRLAKIATFQPLPVLVGPGGCGATDAVLIDTVILPNQGKVAITPPATMRCPMAEEVAHWVREDVAPSLKDQPPLTGLDNFDSYSCRGRNNVRAAQLSEHGKADAIDVRDFKLADGRELGLTDVNVDKDWRDAIKSTACARFMTVLGPGSDGYHEQHIHLDLEERHNDYKVCQWDVRVPPPPAEAQAAPSSGQAVAQADAPPASEPIPLDEVPLPRPRPVAQIERALSSRPGSPQ